MATDKDVTLAALDAASVSVATARALVVQSWPDPPPVPLPPSQDIRVAAGDNLQAAYDAALPGQRLLLDPAGVWPSLVLRKKGVGGPIEVTTDGAADLPGQQLTSGAGLAKIGGGPGPAISTDPGGGNAHLHNLELLPTTDTARFSTVVYLGTGMEHDVADLAHTVTLRRIYSVVDWTKQTQRRFVRAECTDFALIDSYAAGYNYKTPDDAQAVIVTNSPGPFLFRNCYLEATGENFLMGGGDPQITNLVPGEAGTLIHRCKFFKPLIWKTALRGYVKCNFELKNAKNVLVDECVFENCWTDAQTGRLILLTVRNQDNSAPWSTLNNIEIRNSRLVGAETESVLILGIDDKPGVTSVRATGLKFSNVQFEKAPRGFLLNRGADGVTLEHCTFADIRGYFLSFEGTPTDHFSFVHNLARSGNYGVHSPTAGLGLPTLVAWAPGYVWGVNAVEKSTNSTTFLKLPPGTTWINAGAITYDAAAGRYQPLINGADGVPVGADLSKNTLP